MQLALPFPVTASYDAADFIAAASNKAARTWLAHGEWPDGRLALWGGAGTGKTHLLHIWGRRNGAVILTGPMLADLDSVPLSGALAIDDASQVADETVLLHLLNTARDRRLTVLLAAPAPPARWPVRLPDLRSRLRAITAAGIGPPGDDLLRALLVRILAERQLDVGVQVREWMLRHLHRSSGALRDAVALLDRESLASRREINLSFAAAALRAAGMVTSRANEVSMAPAAPSCQISRFI